MLDRQKIVCLGGDARSPSMVRRLVALGARVCTYALDGLEEKNEIEQAGSLDEALQKARAVILPMPAFDDRGRLNCPLSKQETVVQAEEVFHRIGQNVAVFGGRLSPHITELAAQQNVQLTDYGALEELQIRNAVPTAEGAICLAMQALDITLSGAYVGILGYGRIGAALADRLRHLGAHVTVAARKTRDIARIECAQCRAVHLCDECSLLPLTSGYDVIFNTIPYRVLPPDLLERMPSKTLLIELASAPGGWDAAAPLPCRTIYAPGLPGKHTPHSAGTIVADVLYPLLKEVMHQ